MRQALALPILGLTLVGLALAAQRPARPRPPYVELRRVDELTWRATYHLRFAARSLRFQRPARFYRERVWRVLTPGYELSRDGEHQILALSADGEPRRQIVVEFPEYSDPIPKSYELFQPFSTGAAAVYTGHLYAAPVGEGYPADAGAVRTLWLQPPEGAHAIVRGQIEPEPFAWTDEIGDGTYIYVGRAEPIETPYLVAIVDPGMPAWLREGLNRYLPQLFQTYAARLNATLPWKPLVLYSFHDPDGAGRGSGGGTLTGLIQMTLSGSGWRQPDPAAEEQAVRLLAHEAAHLWNGQLVSSPGGGAAWMHEGAADAMANDLLLEFGVIDSATHRTRRQEAINRCALGVTEGPVDAAHRRGAFRVFYDCGHVMALWTMATVHQHDEGADLFTFWRRLLAAGLEGGGAYDEELYFELLAEAGVGDDVRRDMRGFLSSADAMDVAVNGLSRTGVRITAGQGSPPAEVQRELARRALAHLMEQRCGRVSFRSEPGVFRTDAIPGCPGFERPMAIARIEGASVKERGAIAYSRVRQRCAAGGNVSVEAADGEILATVRCSEPLPSVPRWYALRG